MTPKQKADELVNRFLHEVPTHRANFGDYQAVKCALICVNEIMLTNPTIKGNSEDLVTMIVQTKAYWVQVKMELESIALPLQKASV